ncbi:MAG: nuclease superfamily, partial [Pseudomonadota bacterium]
ETVYIFEFKTNAKATNQEEANTLNTALIQIKERNYQEKYLAENKTIFLVGIEFDINARGVGCVVWERV